MPCIQGPDWRGGLGGLPTPYVVLNAGELALQKWQLVFLSFCTFCVYNFSQLLYAHSCFSPLRISLWASLVVQW